MHHLAKNPEQMIKVEERMMDRVSDEGRFKRLARIQVGLEMRGLVYDKTSLISWFLNTSQISVALSLGHLAKIWNMVSEADLLLVTLAIL